MQTSLRLTLSFGLIALLALGLVPVAVGAESNESARERLAALTVGEKLQLEHDRRHFAAASIAEQELLRKIASSVESSESPAQTLGMLERYHDWLATLAPAQREELLDLSPAERIAKIRALRAKPDAGTAPLPRLPRKDLEQIIKVMGSLAWPARETLLTKMPEPLRKSFSSQSEAEQRKTLAAVAWNQQWRTRPDARREFWEEMLKQRESLGSEAQRQLDEAQAQHNEKGLTFRWMQMAFRELLQSQPAQRRVAAVRREELFRFMREELTEEQRQRLHGLSREEMIRELNRLHREAKRPAPKGPRREPPAKRERPAAPTGEPETNVPPTTTPEGDPPGGHIADPAPEQSDKQ